MKFTLIQKADVADDPDPNVTPPARARIFTTPTLVTSSHITAGSLALFVRVLDAQGNACPDGAASISIDTQNDATGTWCLGAAKQTPAGRILNAPLPEIGTAETVFVRLQSIVGTNAASAEIYWAARP